MNYKSSFFRGGGCGASKSSMPKYQQLQIQIPMATMDQIKIQIQKIKDCTNPEYLLGHIQFFLVNERYLQFLTENVQACQAHYPYIQDRLYDLLNAIIFNLKLRTKLSQQCAYHLIEITTKLMKMVFVFCANDNQIKPIRMPLDKYNNYQSLITQIKVLISSEETDKFYKNSLWYEYQMIYIIWNMIPNESQPKIEDVAISIVSHSITAFSTGIINPKLFAAIFDGIKLLYKAKSDNTAKIKFQIIYSLELIRWRLIEQIERNDPFNISKQTILDVYQYVKATDDWMIMFCWIKNLGALFNHLPTIRQDLMSEQDLFKFVKKQYLFKISNGLYQININFDQLQSDPDVLHLISHVEAFQNLAQMQLLILKGNDILPSFENYYLTSDTKPDESKDTLTLQEKSYEDLRLSQMKEFIQEIQKEITDFQNEVELTILQGNSKIKKNCDFSKIQLNFHQLFDKIFSLNLFQGQLEFIERLWKLTKPEYFSQIQQNKCEANQIEIQALKCVIEQELKRIKFAQMMNDTKGQSQNMDAEFIDVFKQYKRQNSNKFDSQQFQFFAEEWKTIQDDPSQENIATIVKKIKNQKENRLDFKSTNTLEQHVQMFQNIFNQYNSVNQLHKKNLKTLLILKCLIQQQFYQKEYYQSNSRHNKEIQLQILCLSKQLLGYDYYDGILLELSELSNNSKGYLTELQKVNAELSIDHQFPVLTLRQIISKDQNLTHFKVMQLLQYFIEQQKSIEQIITDQSVEDLNSYFDILCAIQQNIFEGITQHKKIYKQIYEYLNILQNGKKQSDDDQISESHLNLTNLFLELSNLYKDVQIDKLNSSKKVFQICQNRIQMYLEQNQSIVEDSIKAQLKNLLKIQSLNQVILDVNLEDSSQNKWAIHIFKEIDLLIKCEPQKQSETLFQSQASPPASPGPSPRNMRQLKSIQNLPNQQGNPLLELYHQKFMDLEILTLQVQDNLVLMKKKNSNYLKLMQALKIDMSPEIRQERSFTVEMKHLRKIGLFQIEEIDDSFYYNYKDYVISATYQQNLKFMTQQIQNTVLNIFVDRPQSKFQIYKQKALDLFSNSPWRFRHQAALLLQQMKDRCLHQSINDCCLGVLTRFYAYESDQRVRYVLENQQSIIQILGQHWPSQEEQIQEQIKENLKDLNNLGFELQQVIDLDQRKIIQFKIQEKQKDIEEIIKNITNVSNALGISILFIQDLKQDLYRIEGKINEISDCLNSMSADIRYLRGKTVSQLLEIRMNRILQNKLIFDSRSVYVQLKTKEKQINRAQEEMETNLYTNDIFGDGEINEFLWKQQKDSMLIHGQAGSGKSTAARKIEEFLWMFYKQNQSIKEQIPLIPIMINLPSLKNPKYQAVEEVLKSDSYRFDNKQILEFKEAIELGKYRLVIILDSYDEMNQSLIGINLNFTNKLQKWRQNTDINKYPKIITTTRTEIFNTNDYYTWFLSESSNAQNNFKEVRLLKFTNAQVQDYLKQFTKLNVKKTLFEYYSQLIPNGNEIDQLERFEQLWAQIQIADDKQQLLSERDVSQIIQLLKQDKNIQMFTNEIERSLNSELKQLWASSVYLTCIQTMHLYDLLETPFMMEIVVQVLPIIVKKKSEPDQIEPTFIKHFVELKLLELNQDDAKILAEKIWETLKDNSNFFNHFQITKNSRELLTELNKEFPQFQESSDSALIVQALLSQDLVQYDYYDFFFGMYFERQIRKLQDNGQAYDYFSLQREIKQFATELAIRMTNEEKTQIEYQSNGLLYKQAVSDNWADHYFDDSDGKEGQFRKLYRSCIPMKQRNSFYSFNHKSLQEFLVAQDFCMFIGSIKNEEIKKYYDQIEKHNVNQKYWFSEFMIGVCYFIVDKLKKDRLEKNKLIMIVQQTAYNNKIVIAGSNCLFLLSKMGEFLGNQNFEGINIKNIDLTGSNFYNSSLKSSKFENVNISNINFNSCNLDQVDWQEIKINQFNLDKSVSAIKQIMFISDQKDTKLISVDESLKIKKFDIKARKEQTFQIQNKNAKIRCCNINTSYLVIAEIFDGKPDTLEILDLQTQQWIQKPQIDFNVTRMEFMSETELLIQNGKLFNLLNLKKKTIEKINGLTFDGSLVTLCTNIKRHFIAFLQKQQAINLKITIFDSILNTHNILTDYAQFNGTLAFSPSGTVLALGVDTEVSLWSQQQKIGTIKLQSSVDQITFSHDETRLMSLSNQGFAIQIWNLTTKQQIGPIYNHDSKVLTMGLSEDNVLIAAGLQNGTIKCWDTCSSELQQIHMNQKTYIHIAFFSRDTQLLLISSKKSIEVWRLLIKMSLIKELKGFKSKLTCMTMSQNLNIVCAGNKEAKIFVWSLSDGELKHAIPTHQSYPLDLKMIDDNQIVSIEINNVIKFINLQERQIKFINKSESFDLYDNIQSYKNAFNVPQPNNISTNCINSNNYYIIQNRHLIWCENNKFVIQFNYFLSKEDQSSQKNISNLDIVNNVFKFGKYKKIFAMVDGQNLVIYHYSKKDLHPSKKQLTSQQSKINIIQFGSHDTIILLANIEKILVFSIDKIDKNDNKQINLEAQLIKQNNEPIIALTYSLNMEYIYGGCQNGNIYRWNYRAEKFIDCIKAPDQLNYLIYSSALLSMISISKNQVKIWNNLQQSEPLLNNDEQFQQFYYSEISQDKLILALAADKYILLIDIEHHEIIDRIQVPSPCEYFCYSSKKLCILARFGNKLNKYQLSVQRNIQQYIVDQQKQPECLSVYKDNLAIGMSNGSILYGTQQCMNEQFQHSIEKVISVHLSSEYLLSGSATKIYIWKLDQIQQNEKTDKPLDIINVKNLTFCKLLTKDQIMVIENNNPIVYLRQNEHYLRVQLSENIEKQQIFMDTNGNSIIVFYKYLHLKRYIKLQDQPYSCSHTYGQNQNIECEDVRLNQAKIVSYLKQDLLKLFNNNKK